MTNTVLTNEQIRNLGEEWSCFFPVVGYENDCIRDIEQAVLQSEQVQAWKRDAERLNWIEEQFGAEIGCGDRNEWWVDWPEGYVEATSMRDAIDAALKVKGI